MVTRILGHSSPGQAFIGSAREQDQSCEWRLSDLPSILGLRFRPATDRGDMASPHLMKRT